MKRKMDIETKLGGIFGIIAIVAILIEMTIGGWSSEAITAGVKDIAGTMIGVMVFIIAIRSLKSKDPKTFEEGIKDSFGELEKKYQPLFKKSIADEKSNDATKNKLEKIYRYNLSTKFERLLRADESIVGKMGKFVDFEKEKPTYADFFINKSTFQKSAQNSEANFDEQKARFSAEVANCISKNYKDFCSATPSSFGVKVKFKNEEGLNKPSEAKELAELVEYVLLLYIVEYQY